MPFITQRNWFAYLLCSFSYVINYLFFTRDATFGRSAAPAPRYLSASVFIPSHTLSNWRTKYGHRQLYDQKGEGAVMYCLHITCTIILTLTNNPSWNMLAIC